MRHLLSRNAAGKVLAGSLAVVVLVAAFAVSGFAQATELPKPTYANSLIISIEHSPGDGAEIDSIKASLPFGLYAWPSLSVTHVAPALAWVSDWTQADSGIAAFKSTVDAHIAAAKAKGVKFHLVVCSGLARSVGIYAEAKTEDVRNAQWFNDGNLGTAAQVASPNALTQYVFGTFSRYARKLRANLEAKSRAAFAFLKRRMDENPETFVAVSGWGEAELSDRRIDNSVFGPQAWFCDYSPFAVLEFRDWITHQGLYDDAAGLYAGEGWTGGGAQYQGAGGLVQFNAAFGTAFASWNLRYYNWALTDDWDAIPGDGVNNDPGRIPLASYAQDGMMPSSGAGYLAGGFDPPRTMVPGNAFYDLWNLFRETMVHRLVQDTAAWAVDEGIPQDRWYSHQIPADYLFGTEPGDPAMNPRYYTSASPLWTAGLAPAASVGASIYDAKFPPDYPSYGAFNRTTEHILPVISAMAANWGILEYDAETYVGAGQPGVSIVQSAVSDILAQYLRVYAYSPHLINFWRWWDATGEHRIKGMNKEAALRDFIGLVRDKARSTDLSVVYTPPRVVGLSGSFGVSGAPSPAAAGAAAPPSGLPTVARLEITGIIWTGETWNWTDWGDFDHFEIYRGATADFAADDAHSVGTTAAYVYEDATAAYGGTHYYKWRAVNSAGARGPASEAAMVSAVVPGVPVLALNRNSLRFGLSQGGTPTPAQPVLISNVGAAATTLAWTAVSNQPWLQALPASGTGNGILQVGILGTGLAAGTYMGTVTVDAPLAADAPQTIDVCLEVYAPGEDAAPFGDFNTPLHESNVSSSIAVTGWVLDDIGVGPVKIKRHPVESDPSGSIEADGLVFIGEATFVRGARPDVEAAYPDYPQGDKAGWGYMLLTNFLPNQGNGTFTLVAVAADTTGHTVNLGEKTIHVDNANATQPFGAIDTPTQGGTASGGVFYNFGWALTPLPASIPVNGSTIWVWLDGVPVAHPSYGHYRGDIATLFPGYANSLGAIGVYNLNTLAMTNATHTIVWSVVDSLGRADGIGSRYFDVFNAGSPAAVSAVPAEARLAEVPGGRFSIETKDRTFLEIEELERVKIEFAAPPGTRIVGWSAGSDKPLPVGSTLDPQGRFWWIPGPGFIGRYVLYFAATDGLSRGPAVEVVIDIVPKYSRKIRDGAGR